jgi:hypothetical protein
MLNIATLEGDCNETDNQGQSPIKSMALKKFWMCYLHPYIEQRTKNG